MSTTSDIERELLRRDSELTSGSAGAMSGLASLECESQLTEYAAGLRKASRCEVKTEVYELQKEFRRKRGETWD